MKNYAKQLIKHNDDRKRKQSEALKRLADGVDGSNKVIIVLDPSIGKGLNGLVSQSVTQKFKRPSIVLGYGDSDNTFAGSFRGLEISQCLIC
ncbi:hypothetical protein D3C75_595860 [compost metagenome]